MADTALILVDVQNDFLPGGGLGVTGGDQVVEPLNRAIALCMARGWPVVATRDWHPPHHCSFVNQGGIWPPHCVAGTPGAAFADGLALPAHAKIVSKATTAEADAYSGFERTGLADWLHSQGIRRLLVGGLATDYCVRQTVEDGLAAGFAVVVLEDAVRAVEVDPGDGERALAAMAARGARRSRSTDSDLLTAAG